MKLLSVFSLRRYLADDRASIIPLTAVMLPLLLGMTGVGVDVSLWLMERRNLQGAADAAVIAGAWEIANGYDELADGAALTEAQNNGYTGDDLDLDIGEDAQGRTTVTTTLSQSSYAYFSKIIFSGDISPTVIASSVVTLPIGDYCMLSLNPTADGALTFSGGVDLDSTGCGIAANSNSDSAIVVNGGGGGTRNIGDIATVGDIGDADVNEFAQHGTVTSGSAPIADPYEDLDIPDFDECSEEEMDNGDVKVSGEVTVYCGGFSIGNGDVVDLTCKICIIDGGDFSVGNGGTVNGDGSTIILTNSAGGAGGILDIKGNLNINAPAPDAIDDDEWDQFEGVAIYGDRNIPQDEWGNGNACHDMKGGVVVNGAIYFPTNCLDIGGGGEAESDEVCSRIIAATIRLHGNPAMGNSCEGSAVEDIGRRSVRLIL